jgi:hypothetical protein
MEMAVGGRGAKKPSPLGAVQLEMLNETPWPSKKWAGAGTGRHRRDVIAALEKLLDV